MNDRDALLTAILASPGEDTPRLMLADWLEEHGDGFDRWRAGFLRPTFPPAVLGFSLRRKQAARPWARYARTCCFTDQVPATWTRWLIPSPGSPEWNGGRGRGSWAEFCSSAHFRCAGARFVFALRHGFANWLALDQRRFRWYAAAIFRRQPVSEVALLDRLPEHAHGGLCWFLHDRQTADSVAALHPCFYRRLRLGRLERPWWADHSHASRRVYTTRAEALDDLSGACVDYARSFAAYNANDGRRSSYRR